MRAPAYFLGDPILFKGDTYCMNQELCTLYTSPNNNNNKMSRQLLFGQVTEMQHWFTENKLAKDFFLHNIEVSKKTPAKDAPEI